MTLVAAPALAAPYSFTNIVVGSFEWETGYTYLAPIDIFFGDYDDTLDDQTFEVTVDDFADSETVECSMPDLATATDGSGDQIVTCDAMEAPGAEGLTVKPSLRIFASGQLARYAIDVTNSSTAPLGFQWRYYLDIGSSDIVWQSEGARGGNTVDMELDNWATAAGDDNEGAPVSYAWGGPNGADRASSWEEDSNDEGYFWTTEAYELQPNETVTYAFFNFVQTSAEATDLTRLALWEATAPVFGSPGGEVELTAVSAADPDYSTLLVGLDNCVANWNLCTEPAPVLPDTGVDGNTGLWAAIAGLIAGIGVISVFAVRRRAQA